MGHLAQGWDKFVDYLGRFLMHATNATAAGRASHSGVVDGQAFNGPIYPTKPAKKPRQAKKDDENEGTDTENLTASQGQAK